MKYELAGGKNVGVLVFTSIIIHYSLLLLCINVKTNNIGHWIELIQKLHNTCDNRKTTKVQIYKR